MRPPAVAGPSLRSVCMRLSMVGTGYVGLVTGVCLANTGNHVTCVDVDAAKVDRLRSGKSPIYEPGLDDLLARNIAAGRLTFTTDALAAHKDADMIFICVGTPSDDRGHTDLRFIFSAADAVADALKSLGPKQKPKVIVVKSTVPVGTSIQVRDRIAARAGADIPFSIANNPEFLKEGAAIEDFMKPDRVVCGVESDAAAHALKDLYDPFVRNGHPIHIMDVLSSEMVKYASNNFLATKISFINEMANLCEAYGADIGRVREGHVRRQTHRQPVPLPRPRLRRFVLPQRHPRLHHDGREVGGPHPTQQGRPRRQPASARAVLRQDPRALLGEAGRPVG